MGIREIRYCDITGADEHPDNPVTPHELHIDQMRARIDLAEGEHQKLLALLRAYIDAGRVEASTPTHLSALPGTRASSRPRARRDTATAEPRPRTTALSAAERDELAQWARDHDIPVPSNRRFRRAVVEQWRTTHTPRDCRCVGSGHASPDVITTRLT